MPGRRQIDPALCRRCQTAAPSVTVRSEPLCRACFCNYVESKVVKRMDAFRVRHAEMGRQRKLLLPLSFGPCSVSLLHVLNHHMTGQLRRTGRTGFSLHVLHVLLDADVPDAAAAAAALLRVQQRYPAHSYSTTSVLEVPWDDNLQALSPLGLAATAHADKSETPFHRLLNATPSATFRADLQQIFLRRCVNSYAKANGCEAVIWGDSTTRLAERTLAETAKGKGASLPWITGDGKDRAGVQYYYPLRELLRHELCSYTASLESPLADLISQDSERSATISARNRTIDGLVGQYFESVEHEYPSVVANVVRTTAKLQAPLLSQSLAQCELCDTFLGEEDPKQSRICNRCIRELPSITS